MRRNFCFCVLMGLMLLGFSGAVVSQFGDPVPGIRKRWTVRSI